MVPQGDNILEFLIATKMVQSKNNTGDVDIGTSQFIGMSISCNTYSRCMPETIKHNNILAEQKHMHVGEDFDEIKIFKVQ